MLPCAEWQLQLIGSFPCEVTSGVHCGVGEENWPGGPTTKYAVPHSLSWFSTRVFPLDWYRCGVCTVCAVRCGHPVTITELGVGRNLAGDPNRHA